MEDFAAQVQRAKEIAQHQFVGVQTPQEAPKGADSMDQLFDHLKDPNFAGFMKDAYNSEQGYALRINPVTGKTEMAIAGTRAGHKQWALNVWDGVIYGTEKAGSHYINKYGKRVVENLREDLNETIPGLGYMVPDWRDVNLSVLEQLDPWRQEKQKYLEEVARDNDVDVIYGHSRGGALLADMDTDAQKVGVDAAMIIAHNTGMLNINEGGGHNPLGLFDAAIGLTGQQNVYKDYSEFSPHKVWTV
jgi:hypothetical protein